MNILGLLYFMLPAYFANMAPVIARRLNWLNYPIDFNIKLNKKPLLGKNKTWRGLIIGIAAGMIVFLIQKISHPYVGFSILDYSSAPVALGFLLSFGSLLGDMVKSFFKRRISIRPGKPWIPFDEIDNSIGSIALASIVFFPGWYESLAVIIITGFLHIAVNHFAYYTGIRGEKW